MYGNGQPFLITSDNVGEFLESFDAIISDCDGVLWRGEEEVPGAAKALQMLSEMGKKIIYLTNDCMKSVESRGFRRCLTFGFPVAKETFYTSARITARYVKRHFSAIEREGSDEAPGGDLRCLVIGHRSLVTEFEATGVLCSSFPEDDNDRLGDCQELGDLTRGLDFCRGATAVAVGFDPRFSYRKALAAASCLESAGGDTLFVATDRELSYNARLPWLGESFPWVIPG